MTIAQIDLILQFVIFIIASLSLAYLARKDVHDTFLNVLVFILDIFAAIASIVMIIVIIASENFSCTSLLFPILLASTIFLLSTIVIVTHIIKTKVFDDVVQTWDYNHMKRSYETLVQERDLFRSKYDSLLVTNKDLTTSLEKLKLKSISQEKIINKNKIQFV